MTGTADPVFQEFLNLARIDEDVEIVGSRTKVIFMRLRGAEVTYSVSVSSSQKLIDSYLLTGLLESRSMGKIVSEGTGSTIERVNIHSFQLGPYDLDRMSLGTAIRTMLSDLIDSMKKGPASLSAEAVLNFYLKNRHSGGVLRSVAIYIAGAKAGYPDDILAPEINRNANPLTSRFFEWVSTHDGSRSHIEALGKL